MSKYIRHITIACITTIISTSSHANIVNNPSISAVLDGYYQSGDRWGTEQQEGFGLGHTEVALSANIDDLFFGKITTVIEFHDGHTELNLEEAFIQTLALPSGFSVRAGRFLSDIGYLNNQHLHSDSFSNRPAVYRAFLGGHYYDDGIRLSYLAPTDLYWNIGVEAFKGDKMRAHVDEHDTAHEYKTVGVYSAFTKLGGDIGFASWQAGLSYLRNENGRLFEDEHEEHAIALASEEHDHTHSALFTGENTYIADFAYKWAPNGNYKYQNLSVSGEYFKVTDFALNHDHAEIHSHSHEDDMQGWYLSGVYQLSPNWSVGARYGQVDVQVLHDDHFDKEDLTESELSIAWHHSHFSTVRFQYTKQEGTNYFGIENDNIFTLQYVMTLGAHDAHQF